MAIKNTAKAEALIRELKERLEIRTAGSAAGRVDTVRQDKDSEGYPALFLSDNGTETAGNPVIAIRIKQIDMVSKDVFGNDSKAYSPHVCEFAYELDGTEAEPNRKDIEAAFWEIARTGIKVEVKEIADATAVSFASMDATAAAAEFDDLRWPNKGA
jgi:hypothetical protein